MANILFMGFERLSAALLFSADVWDITAQGNLNQVSGTAPRNGGSGQAMTSVASSVNYGTKSLGSNYSHLFVGVGYMIRSATISASPTECTVVLYDGTTAQIGWKVLSDGSIGVYRGSTTAATLLGQTAAGVITAKGTSGSSIDYVMIEMEVIFATGATGTIVLNVGGITVLTVPTVQTAASANAYANRVRLGCCNVSAMTERLDDFYINDDSGSAPENTFFGEAFVVEGIIPNGNGNSSQWVGSDGNSTDNYLLVDDNGNGDTDYVRSGTLNDIDTYALSDLSNGTGTIIGINHQFQARKDDVATRKIASVIRDSSTNYLGSDKTMTGSYVLHSEKRLVNPTTSLRFTIAEINALEAGQKVTT